MLNIIWAIMIVIGIVYGAFSGNISDVGNAFMDSSREAVSLCITMVGIMSFWNGIMEVAKESGLVRALTKKIEPFVKWIFPHLSGETKAQEYISLNFIANILGMGWAATPAGLRAMEELSKEEQLRENVNEELGQTVASNEMCAFLVINISSLQLIPVSIITYRAQYGSASPTSIVMPAIIATMISTVVGIIICKICSKIK